MITVSKEVGQIFRRRRSKREAIPYTGDKFLKKICCYVGCGGGGGGGGRQGVLQDNMVY